MQRACSKVVADTPRARQIAERLTADSDHAPPHVVDVEVLGVIRARHICRGRLDGDSGRAGGHRPARLARTAVRPSPADGQALWQLRDSVRGWTLFYVALAEACDATLLTLDTRLACTRTARDVSDRGRRSR